MNTDEPHKVESHLQLEVAAYDQLIREFVPAYEPMRGVQLGLLAIALPEGKGRVLDLGGGTGALAAAILERFPGATVEIWDTDPKMLASAKKRCAGYGERAVLVERTFTDPLPPCDAVAACIALHHVRDLSVKAGIYRNIHAALRPGGLFVNADTAAPSSGPLRERVYEAWARSMAPFGYTREQAFAHFQQWSVEDFYPPLWRELSLLRDAGFEEPECFWRDAAAVVFGAEKR